MIGIALGFLRIAWPYILAALVAAYVYHLAESWCNSACVKQQALTKIATDRAVTAESKLDILDKARIAQEERWAQATAAEEQRERQQEQNRKAKFAGRADAARVSITLRGISVPRISLDGLRDAGHAAEPVTESPGKTTEAPAADPTAAAIVGWGIDILEWSAECRARVDAWTAWYQSLRTNP